MANLLEMYEQSRELNNKLSEINTKKSLFVDKIKSLETKDANIESELDALNSDFEKTSESLKALNEKIKSKEQESQAVSSEVDAETTSDSINKGGSISMTKSYLNSSESMNDFAKVLKKSVNGDFQENWKSHLITKGINNTDVFLPNGIVQSIQDVILRASSFYKELNHSGLKFYKVIVIEDGTIQAYGHKPGKAKKEQEVNPTVVEIRPSAIYKYLTLDKGMLVENDEKTILDWVLAELPAHVIQAIERAVVIGDGLAVDNQDHISSFAPIVADKLTTKIDVADEENLIEELVTQAAMLEVSDKLIMVINPKLYGKLSNVRDSKGDRILPLGSFVNSLVSIDNANVYKKNWMPENQVIVFDPKAYTLVGQTEIESYDDFKLQYNQFEYLSEIYAGGALTQSDAALVINLTASAGQ